MKSALQHFLDDTVPDPAVQGRMRKLFVAIMIKNYIMIGFDCK